MHILHFLLLIYLLHILSNLGMQRHFSFCPFPKVTHATQMAWKVATNGWGMVAPCWRHHLVATLDLAWVDVMIPHGLKTMFLLREVIDTLPNFIGTLYCTSS